MTTEVAIINAEPHCIYEGLQENQKIGEQEHIFTPFIVYVKKCWQWDKDKNGKPKAINGNPEYVAIHANGTRSLRVILKVDFKKSHLSTGKIVCQGRPIRVYIPIKRYSQDRAQGIRYTSFEKLLTHNSTADFIKPKRVET